jgi:hypothetical protein
VHPRAVPLSLGDGTSVPLGVDPAEGEPWQLVHADPGGRW